VDPMAALAKYCCDHANDPRVIIDEQDLGTEH
jgi:hypothetical protein